MEPIAVAAALLREVVPDVQLRAGASVVARVASRGEQHGVLVLAGIPLTAELPPDVPAGATLRLRVQQADAERVVLRVEPQPLAAPGPVGAPARPVPPRVAVTGRPARRALPGGGRVDSVALSFTSPRLGRIDLRLDLRGNDLEATVEAVDGPPLVAARTDAERLRATLVAHGFNAAVQVRPRHEPLDVYA